MAIDTVTTQTLFKEWRVITNAIITALGDNDTLNTTEKGSLVGAINEIDAAVGDITSLNTTAQDAVVNAVNEVLAAVGDITTLTTTDQSSTVNAIIEVVSAIGVISNLNTTDKASLVSAVNELDFFVGDLTALTTAVKGDAVQSVAVNDGGTGYTANDVLTLVAGNSDATVTVTGETGGVIDTVSITTKGTGYANATGVSVTGGTGSSALIDITVGTITDAINELDAGQTTLETNQGDLASLTTTAQATLVAAINEIDAAQAAHEAAALTQANLQVNNLELNHGRFASETINNGIATFSLTDTLFTAHNSATLAEGDAFYDDNSSNGGAGPALGASASSLLTAMARTDLRYGTEFYILDITASTGTADGQLLAATSQNYYPVCQNGNVFLSRAGNTVTWIGWVKAESINDAPTFTGIVIGDANVTTYIDGSSTPEATPKVLEVADGWTHVRQTMTLTKEYENIFPAIYANNLDNILVACSVLLDGDVDIGTHEGVV